MVQSDVDTIVAEATPKGRGGVGIVRISGPKVPAVAESILKKIPALRQGEYLSFWDESGEIVDQGIALYFKAPNSFTGEDVLELQGHGGPVVIDSLIQAAIQAGARLALPGEFSLRAFLNNKIDLCQAEAVSDLINATSKQAAKCAIRSLQGVFSQVVEDILKSLIHLRMYVESAIDFPEEEIDFLSDDRILLGLNELIVRLEEVHGKAHQGSLMSEGAKVVIVGRPNAGKSSLLNRLSGYDRAIVTDIPGTTRDVLREQISIDGLLVELIDTAGLRMAPDVIEQQGIERALQELRLADHVIVMVDGSATEDLDPKNHLLEWREAFPSEIGITVLCNKIDKIGQSPKVETFLNHSVVYLSAKTGEGVSLFRDHLKKTLGFTGNTEGNFIARRRHLEALSQAKQHVIAGKVQLEQAKAGELLAEELRQAQLALDQITGKFSSDDLLGKIFAEFCIGK